MSLIDSDIIEDFINEGHFQIDDAGPLYAPISDLKIQRDEKLDLVLTTVSGIDASSKYIDVPAGTVSVNDSLVEMTGHSGSKVRLYGVLPVKNSTSYSDNLNSCRTEQSLVSYVEVEIGNEDDGCYLIEWLENVDDGFYLWPDSVKTQTEEKTSVTIGIDPNKVEMKESSSTSGFASSCLSLKIEDYKFHLVSSGKDERSVGVKSGYILFEGIPSDEIRKKIRNSLSFALGKPFVKTGYSIFDRDWKLVSMKSKSAYSMNGAAFLIHTMPPSPLDAKYQNGLDKNMVCKLVYSIYKNYEKYKFGYLSWAYWHAVTAPSHIAAVHFGACIESLQKSYIDNNGKIFKSALIDKEQWKPFKNKVLEILNSLELNERDMNAFVNKINNLNQAPQRILNERFFNSLNINFSEIERKAWGARNNAAHGNLVKEDEEITLIRELKILKVLFHRIFIRIIEGGEYYYDYYSYGFPIKLIEQGIEE